MGTVSGNSIAGKRVSRGQANRTVESWKVDFAFAGGDGDKQPVANNRMKFTFYDAFARTHREFGSLDEAKKAVKEHAAKMDAKYPGGTPAFGVYVDTDNGGSLEVYMIRCTRGRFTENEAPLLLQDGLRYLRGKGN